MASTKASSKGAKKEGRCRTPPEKKKTKGLDENNPPIPEEAEKAAALKSDDIKNLIIRPEDLEKLHVPNPPAQKAHVTSKFLIRKHKPRDGEDEVQKPKVQLLVAKPAPSSTHPKAMDYSGPGGPLFDVHGQILPHSILGTLEEFKQEALEQGNIQVAELIPDTPHTQHNLVSSSKYIRQKPDTGKTQQRRNLGQHHSLENWQRHMAERKKQQGFISRLLQKPVKKLLMNQSEDYRLIQEQRQLIDHSIPTTGYGKGYRVGSEFWSQPERIGDKLHGLMMTLTRTQRGYPEPLTHVGRPSQIRLETGTEFGDDKSDYRYTWDKNLYLLQRREELKAVLKELDFSQPDIDGLEVIGTGQPFTSVSVQFFPRGKELRSETVTDEKENKDPLEDYPEVISEAIHGPSLQFCRQPARWLGNSSSYQGEIGIAARITFEALTEEKAISKLNVTNDGTTAIWYNWQRLPQAQSFKDVLGEVQVQRFYFNIAGGVIFPGQTITFTFLFKSPNAGMFNEFWEFCTHPVLLGGASLQVSLHGIALSEDKLAHVRQSLEEELEDREALTTVERLVNELLEGVQTPERPATPVNTYITEEELFCRNNPQLYYKHSVVKSMKDLWVQCFQSHKDGESVGPQSPMAGTECSWNLSVPDFKQALLSIPDEASRDEALALLNMKLLELCSPQNDGWHDLLYQICYQIWQETMDQLVGISMLLRTLLGMPEKDLWGEPIVEDIVDHKKVTKGGKAEKEEKKAMIQREEKKGAAGKDKDEKKGSKQSSKEKEERPGSKKGKIKEEKKPGKSQNILKEGKEPPCSPDSMLSERVESRQDQLDPVLHENYRVKLYTEVYGLLVSMVDKITVLFEDVKRKN
ncbi:MYCBP-associated protein [Protopterus annectens]|uniref:MYCBP-associated protein n=1 Tax=Protopterus annectens TaxID=7888 RepID=UPI001CFB8C08|nr:MYCBP-associated protein [Protopterus annectens]